jgi:ATP-dependent helicase HrpA
MEPALAQRAPLVVPGYPGELPIVERREELLEVLAANQVVVVAGETGSGKSTQLPKLCLELGRGTAGMIGHTQPRRLAARAVAERLAEELGTEVGDAVGYTVRFTDRVGEGTYVKVMTDGILLAEIQRDRDLRAYDTLILDEAHERSLNIDFLLGYLSGLLPRRRDLKLVITSATIDTQRFAEHFGAPVVEVSGRTYPVEVRYRPFGEDPGDDRDQTQAIVDAVAELRSEGPGDVLVFCSGEREIRDAADALRREELPGTEVLPLYARLSAAEQHRVFAPHRGRRIVLATNVAETSLTVPGIRYVVDPGTARISRYNRRTKVQRLPIEAISQASADQRAGRCGRVAPGICIRLYSQDDLDARPEFTEPEVLRTNLASVILQMAALGLGDVAAFPFVEPPDRRAVADGVALLAELGALRDPGPDGEVRLTKLGRRLARLPVDPRLGRMVLAAGQEGCAREVLVIAAALAIIDPRERPTGREAEAAELHGRFAHPDSDFLALLALWEHLREAQRQRSSSAFRRMCKAELLNHLRVREWQDVHRQLRQVAAQVGIRLNDAPAHPDAVHRALLAGLLSHVGQWDQERQDYRGPRDARFTIGAGSGLAKRRPRWVMAAELVETNRLRARTVARIRPEWLESVGAHLVKRTHSEPWWDPGRGTALVEERVTLFGLPVAERRVPAGRVDAVAARDLFVLHGLVRREWEHGHLFLEHDFLARNAHVVAEVEALEAKSRRRDLLVTEDAMAAAYAARLPDDVCTVRHFERWWRDRRQADPGCLDLELADLVEAGAGLPDPAELPDRWETGDLVLQLTYVFDPGSSLDGVVVDVPLDVLGRIEAARLDWQVPGRRLELVTALVRTLPKPLRRALVPVPDTVRAILEEVGPADGPLLDVLARALSGRSGQRVTADDFDLDAVPDDLLVTYRAVDGDGRPVAWSRWPDALRARLAERVRGAVSSAAVATRPDLERTGLTSWDMGDLPRTVEARVDGRPVTGFPALVDGGASVAVRVLPSAAEADAAMAAGTRRLLLLGAKGLLKQVRGGVPEAVKRDLVGSPIASVAELVVDSAVAAVDDLVERSGGPAWDAAGFAALERVVAAELVRAATEVAVRAGRILAAARQLRDRLGALHAPALDEAVVDLTLQLDGLVHPGFVVATGARRLRHVERYLAAMAHRSDRLGDDLVRDRLRQAEVAALMAEYGPVRHRDPEGRVRWMLEELRVSLFAQQLGTDGPVSVQRVRKAIAAL